ncbi:MAG: PorV/PorQ family protein [Ignavibacteria bacterium]|nr:PorV/PorQ family protein [Ignavibacteria bacterium]
MVNKILVHQFFTKIFFCVAFFFSSVQTLHSQLVPNLGGQRAGISVYQFLKIGAGGRGTAMGESFTAVVNDASALYWNPAAITNFEYNQIIVSHTQWFVDIQHEFLGGVYHLSAADAIGVSFTSLHLDDMLQTTETQPFGTGRYFTFGDIAIAGTYARKMTEQFSFGVSLKYVEETLDMLKMRSMLVDVGTYYYTGIGTSRFAVVVTNFGNNATPTGTVELLDGKKIQSFQSFSPPTLFKMGFAFEPYQSEFQRITTSAQINHPNDNAENLRVGIEYEWNKTLFLRGGIKRTFGQELFGEDETSAEYFSLGAGFYIPLSFTDINVDYSFAHFQRLGGAHRISLSIAQ